MPKNWISEYRYSWLNRNFSRGYPQGLICLSRIILLKRRFIIDRSAGLLYAIV